MRSLGRLGADPIRTQSLVRLLISIGLVVAIGSLPATTASAGATKDLEQSAIHLDACSSHFGQLEHDAREEARDFCANLGGVGTFDPFVQSEEIVRENEFSKKYSCTVRGRVECYADE